ncbi:MAG TPA: ATP synthase F1 subunit epsilon [Polyangiaceae bacterium]|jgi:F-type H+-transporting ATPase subunit epsilon|nr:ATP synthase F1 subunit epsilon [Polyangiaceae bacterium]
MADAITLEIVTPDGRKLQESVSAFTAPSVEGEFGVLPGHRPMLAALRTGIVSYTAGGKATQVAVGPGFAEVLNDKAVLLTQAFCRKEDVDPVAVRLNLKDADEALDKFQGDPGSPEHVELVAKELWAAAQLELYGDAPPPTVRTVYEMAGVPNYLADESDDSRDSN